MEVLIPIFGITIPVVAIVGGIGYQMFTRWQEGEEKRLALQASNGSTEIQQRVRALEDDLALMRTELVDRSQDIEERLMRIEILLKEVE